MYIWDSGLGSTSTAVPQLNLRASLEQEGYIAFIFMSTRCGTEVVRDDRAQRSRMIHLQMYKDAPKRAAKHVNVSKFAKTQHRAHLPMFVETLFAPGLCLCTGHAHRGPHAPPTATADTCCQ